MVCLDSLAFFCAEDASYGARGTVERAFLSYVDGARVQPHRVARGHDLRLEVSSGDRFRSFNPHDPRLEV